MKFSIYPLGELVSIKYGKDAKKVFSKSGTIPIYGTGGLMGYATKALYDKPSVLIGRKGTIEKIRYVEHPFWTVDTLFYTIVKEDIVIPKFLYYNMLQLDLGRYNEGTSIPSLRTEALNRIELSIPDIETQKKIASILSPLDAKIELNNAINENLEQQAQAIFDNIFPNVSRGEKTIGEYIIPKHGKSLISKNAILGNVPVIAGGLEPSTYHSIANTIAPVVTISASGANAGYVSLWNIPVWSSDSSFIDLSMTNDVYFWYVMLKKRQAEIFDSQTGSVQPHVFPKHIAILPTMVLNQNDISYFTYLSSPLFNKIGYNKIENQRLASLRDTLLPKLMKGEIDVSKVKI